MLALDALEGCAKKPYKNRFFLSTLLLDAEETEKRRKKQKKESNTQKMGGLENGQEVVPPFFPQKIGFFEILKNPYFYSVSRKNGWSPFFLKKAMLQGGHF